ncbi:MAG: hypothetical protein AAB631_03175 [Patescibacteria group bacterium]
MEAVSPKISKGMGPLGWLLFFVVALFMSIIVVAIDLLFKIGRGIKNLARGFKKSTDEITTTKRWPLSS